MNLPAFGQAEFVCPRCEGIRTLDARRDCPYQNAPTPDDNLGPSRARAY
jgi:hypothetical protein